VIDELDRNRRQLERELTRELPDVRWEPPQGTYLAWLDCKGLDLDRIPRKSSSSVGAWHTVPVLPTGGREPATQE
jgi:bifunctional pyridoxal-dependent enzyme with beta-cystathionase and maltose regulon repressor activities